jgi:hypothetical protein
MESNIIALWILTGFALSTWFMMHIWLPDPPPFNVGKYVGILLAGGLGAVIGGYLVHRGSSDPMPALIGAAAGGLFLSGAMGFMTGSAGKSAH